MPTVPDQQPLLIEDIYDEPEGDMKSDRIKMPAQLGRPHEPALFPIHHPRLALWAMYWVADVCSLVQRRARCRTLSRCRFLQEKYCCYCFHSLPPW